MARIHLRWCYLKTDCDCCWKFLFEFEKLSVYLYLFLESVYIARVVLKYIVVEAIPTLFTDIINRSLKVSKLIFLSFLIYKTCFRDQRSSPPNIFDWWHTFICYSKLHWNNLFSNILSQKENQTDSVWCFFKLGNIEYWHKIV